MAVDVASVLRGLRFADMLGWVGLERRRGPLSSIAFLGAGVVVGVGVGMLFAPLSGSETRRALLNRFKGLEKDAERAVEKVEAGAKDIERKAEDFVVKKVEGLATSVMQTEREVKDAAGKAKDAAVGAERKIENKVAQGYDAAKDALKNKVDPAAAILSGSADEAKQETLSPAHFNPTLRRDPSKLSDTKSTASDNNKTFTDAGAHPWGPARHS